jgi:hypothetical protein
MLMRKESKGRRTIAPLLIIYSKIPQELYILQGSVTLKMFWFTLGIFIHYQMLRVHKILSPDFNKVASFLLLFDYSSTTSFSLLFLLFLSLAFTNFLISRITMEKSV